LTFDWEDPEDFDEDAIDLKTTRGEFLSHYYKLIYNILANNNVVEIGGFYLYRFVRLGLTIGLRASIFEAYRDNRLQQIEAGEMERFQELAEVSGQQFYIGSDGVAVGISDEVRELLMQGGG
jgi:hypothetical protein